MAISEVKMQMVIANYFKNECDVNMSIRQAFEKGFRIGVKKGASTNRPQEWIPCSERLPEEEGMFLVTAKKLGFGCEYYDVKIEYCAPFHEWIYVGNYEVVAWMPLPEPWKGADDE